jgi:PEP-CTERM motif
MKFKLTVGKLFALALLAGSAAQAGVILDVTDALALTDPTQLGRLSRNGIAQDWVGTEVFPGVINTTTTYHYKAYSVVSTIGSFIQIDFDSGANLFVSAYDTAYLPNSAGAPNFGFDINWLGDPGSSGSFFGVDPQFFNVVVPPLHTLLVIVSNTAAANVGVGDPFHLTVEAFVNTDFDEAPEPSTFLLGGLGLAALAIFGKKQLRGAGPCPAKQA